MNEAREETTEQTIKQVESAPGLRTVTRKVIQLLDGKFTSFEAVEDAIRLDQTLVVQILRFANARYYGKAGDVGSLRQAIQLLGLNSVQSIAIQHELDRQYTVPENPAFPRDEFWQYSLATGVCAELIADELGYNGDQKRESFSAGHIHAVGKAIIDQYMPEEFTRIIRRTKTDDIPMYQAENDVLGITHCEVGARVFEKWNLTPSLVETARHYYQPPPDASQIVYVVHLASALIKTKQYGFSGDYDISYFDEDRLKGFEFPVGLLEKILSERLPEKYERVKKIYEE